MTRLNLNPVRKHRMIRDNLGLWIAIILFLGLISFLVIPVWKRHIVSDMCDQACVHQNYAAGEALSYSRHKVCVCWPEKLSNPVVFLLEKNNN